MLPTVDASAALFVANHISWLDIWAINAVRTVRFVAKSEVRQWPLIGWLSEKAGVIFIHRGRRHDTGRVADISTQALKAGDCLCVFPEGTTSDGTFLFPFRSSLLQPAVDAGVAVWPVAIAYRDGQGAIMTAVAYAGDTTMAQSMWTVLGQKEIIVQLTYAQPLPVEGHTRKELATLAEQVISSLGRLQVRAAPEKSSDLPA